MSDLIVLDGCRTVQLHDGRNTLIDDDAYAEISRWKWRAQCRDRASTRRKHYYACCMTFNNGQRAPISVHRILAGATKGVEVDHRNGDGLDNRRDNLRLCTKTENKRNVRSTWGRSKYKGISYDSRKRAWRARLKRADGVRISLGLHSTEEDAARAYDCAAIEHYGEFAATNAEIFGDL
jgi:hypothetical protein